VTKTTQLGGKGMTVDIGEWCFQCDDPIDAKDWMVGDALWDDDGNWFHGACYEEFQGEMESDDA